jgi:hypothetical protein
MSPYREAASTSINCPRCGVETAGGELVACLDACGVWVTSEAAQTAFEPSELRPSRIASWVRTLCGCPLCGKSMTLRGHDMSLFQGCDAHGFWVDDTAVTQTGLGRTVMTARLGQARAQARLTKEARARAPQEERERAEAAERLERDRAQMLARDARERANALAQQALEREAAAAAEAARQREIEVQAAEARRLAQREAKRERLADQLRAAIAGGDMAPIIDELMRLDDAITTLANRVGDRGI